VSRFLPACCKWNADGVTYVFTPAGAGEKVCCLAPDSDIHNLLEKADASETGDEEVQDSDVEQPTVLPAKKSGNGRNRHKSRSVNNGLPFAIKVMHCASAAGESMPACVVVAAKNMPAESFYVHENVLGLSWSTQIGASGFLYIAKTRCGTKGLWMHWFRNVVIPALKASKAAHEPKVCTVIASVPLPPLCPPVVDWIDFYYL
jgi:hypothetical protein